ncbi:MAG TPA: hypothetical protein VK932_24820 [Kofleriaceae bacterium]|nr:hypothetical protein [Kofleriaceae bacterium]
MNVLKKHLSIGLIAIAAAAAAITWVSASGVVVLYPATIDGSLTLSSETVTSIRAEFYPTAGGQEITKTVSATAPGPYPFDLTVDGGDPSNPDDAGVSYRPSIYAYLQNSTASQTYLRFHRNNPIVVDNTAAEPSVTVPISFDDYPTTSRANASISVVGGTISSYYLYTSASDSASNESYYGRTYGSTSSQSSVATWIPMVPRASVSVYGTVYLTDGQGNTSQRSLSTQTVDMSGGNVPVSWTIDLTNTGSLEGDIGIVAAPSSPATPTNYYVVYQGASQSTWGIYGQLAVSPSVPHYSLALTPGDYDVFLRTYLSNPAQYSETEPVRVTISAGATITKHFNDAFGVARVAFDVNGFFGLSSLQSAQSRIRTPTYHYGYYYQMPAGDFEHAVPIGTWRPYQTYLRLYDLSNPDLPNNNQMYRYHYNDADLPAVSVGTSGVTDLGTESFTLVKSNVYFDVEETQAQKDQGISVDVSSPQIEAYKNDYNSDQSLRRRFYVYSYGSSVAKPQSALTMVAEPGTYVLDARAVVNGTLTRFGGASITFGEPVSTPGGSGVETVLTPAQNPQLNLSLTFDQVDTAGITTVVETPLGPAPPEGFSAVCEDNGNHEFTCDPVYYDITSNAVWTGSAKVCIRRQYSGLVGNGVAEILRLYHYDEGTESWDSNPATPEIDALPPVDIDGDGFPEYAFDCSADLSKCGCADEASCGIDLNADPVLSTFLVCGMTTSFSPFAVFQRIKFDNVVNGVEHTGPAGPPALQRWTVPADGTYKITATGAAGANGTNSPSLKGGCGAEVTGEFTLQAGEVIEMLVGQKGTAAPYSAGGGGGTFVTKNGAPLLIAGGGGGVRAGALVNGRPGTLSSSGTAGSTSSNYTTGFVAGGADGMGGSRAVSYGAGGGGWLGNGASDSNYGEGGFAYQSTNQAKGGAGKTCGAPAHGGYGGGAAGNGCYGGGGGGGYSGGGGGRVGGGGGSLNNGANPTGQEGKCTPKGHGSVIIQVAH